MRRLILTLLFAIPLFGCELDDDTSSEPTPTADLTGKVEYQDRMYSDTGFTGSNPFKPVRYATVDLLDSNGILALTTSTDAFGNYQFTNVSSGDYMLRVVATTADASGFDVSVNDQSAALYAVTSPVSLNAGTNTSDLRISLDSGMAGVFNILDVFISAEEYVAAVSQTDITIPGLNAFWERGDPEGTYTCQSGCTNGNGIYILSDLWSGDTDEFDDDVLWHEFAHFMEFTLGEFDSPGGYHTLTDNTLDLRLAWSEGHGNYFQTAVKTWLKDNFPVRLSIPSTLAASWYVDTIASTAMAVDFGGALDGSSFYRYASNEAAIAKVLWGLKERLGVQPVFNVLEGHLSYNATADTLESFWDGLVQQQLPTSTEKSQWQAILSERNVFYQTDSHEPDSGQADAGVRDCTVTTGGAVPFTCVEEEHYLYTDVEQQDSDYFALDLTAGVTYTIATMNLKNGADTLIRLYDSLGTPLSDPSTGEPLANDDYFDCGSCNPMHDGTNFRSQLSYTPATDETVYVEVATTDYVYNNVSLYGYIGRYGTYTLKVDAVATAP